MSFVVQNDMTLEGCFHINRSKCTFSLCSLRTFMLQSRILRTQKCPTCFQTTSNGMLLKVLISGQIHLPRLHKGALVWCHTTMAARMGRGHGVFTDYNIWIKMVNEILGKVSKYKNAIKWYIESSLLTRVVSPPVLVCILLRSVKFFFVHFRGTHWVLHRWTAAEEVGPQAWSVTSQTVRKPIPAQYSACGCNV